MKKVILFVLILAVANCAQLRKSKHAHQLIHEDLSKMEVISSHTENVNLVLANQGIQAEKAKNASIKKAIDNSPAGLAKSAKAKQNAAIKRALASQETDFIELENNHSEFIQVREIEDVQENVIDTTDQIQVQTPQMGLVSQEESEVAPMLPLDLESTDYVRSIDQMELEGSVVNLMFESNDQFNTQTIFAQMQQIIRDPTDFMNDAQESSFGQEPLIQDDAQLNAIQSTGAAPMATQQIINNQPLVDQPHITLVNEQSLIQQTQEVQSDNQQSEVENQTQSQMTDDIGAPMQSLPEIEMNEAPIIDPSFAEANSFVTIKTAQFAEQTLAEQVQAAQQNLYLATEEQDIQVEAFDYSNPEVQKLELEGAPLEVSQMEEVIPNQEEQLVNLIQMNQLNEEPLMQQVQDEESVMREEGLEIYEGIQAIDYSDPTIVELHSAGIPMGETEFIQREFIDAPAFIQIKQEQEQQLNFEALGVTKEDFDEWNNTAGRLQQQEQSQQTQSEEVLGQQEVQVQEQLQEQPQEQAQEQVQEQAQEQPQEQASVELQLTAVNNDSVSFIDTETQIDTSMPVLEDDINVKPAEIISPVAPQESAPQQSETLQDETRAMVDSIVQEENYEILENLNTEADLQQ